MRNFLAENWYYAVRMYASRGPYDVWAAKPLASGGCKLLFVQVKAKREYMHKKDWVMLKLEAAIAGAIPLLAYRIRRGRERPIIFETEQGVKYDV